MNEIIFNEYEYVEKLENKQEELSTIELKYIIKHYNTLLLNDSDILKKLMELKPNEKVSKLSKLIKQVDKQALKEPKEIIIYQEELDFIDKEENLDYRRVMFTLLCLTKFFSINGTLSTKNRTATSFNNIIKLSHAKIQNLKYNLPKLMYHFGNNKYLDMFMPNVSIVTYLKTSGIERLKFYAYRDMEFEYESYIGKRLIRCNKCGKLFVPKSNASKYCKECSNK